MKNNIKKAPVKFRENMFQHFMPIPLMKLTQSCTDSSFFIIFVSPAKQKRDICTAFPASSLSSSSAAAA